MRKFSKNQLGDTIVEVMVAILVLSLTLGGTYAIASKSLKAGRQAQERGEALKLAETQMENVKSAAANGDNSVFNPAAFCFNPGYSTATPCNFNSLYNVTVTSVPVAGITNSYQFTVQVQWDSLGASASGKDQLTMSYRVLKE